jgi:ABC-type transport system involved in multi-copper enzyme maturation permease subunit
LISGPAFLYALFWLIRDTFRQALASRVFWIMLTVSGVCTVFCLGVSVEGGLEEKRPEDTELYVKGTKGSQPFTGHNPNPTRLSLMFGIVRDVQVGRHPEEAIHLLQVILASYVAGTLGVLLTLVWTAGFLPDFLQPSAASVLFAKPVPRWTILLGKYAGVVSFVAFQAAVFFGATWLALGLRTNVWLYAYLWAIPLLVLHFAVVFTFSAVLAVWTRSTVATMFGSLLFWLVCYAMNLGHHYAAALPLLAPGGMGLPPFTSFLTEAGYWFLPKPLDFGVILERATGVPRFFESMSSLVVVQKLEEQGRFSPEWVVLSSIGFGALMLFVACRQLATTDY